MNHSAQTIENPIDAVLKNADHVRTTKGNTKIYEKTGGYDQALEDFDNLNPTGVKEIETPYGTGKTGHLEDGQKVIVRPGSSDGRPTLEIQKPTSGASYRKTIEIRY
ncbi:hypothetical protein LJC64_01250 [Ruminococcaceae bacterium OttesenSCG-928-A11]|nr:hypothetical protein [Ruminococcaceae bacterium OttesenSCG-928-A11]